MSEIERRETITVDGVDNCYIYIDGEMEHKLVDELKNHDVKVEIHHQEGGTQ